jgi:transcriptional regulator with PAS, ATPase and Fis domain/TPR repeat protein
LIQRFAYQDHQVYDRWRKEKLSLRTVHNSPEILARLHHIYAFHSSMLQNIVDFTPGNFQINVLTQPFAPSRNDALSRLPAAQTASTLRHCLAFLDAARKWNMDFVDFSRFELLPSGSLRFAWTLEPQELPTPAAVTRLLCGDSLGFPESAASPPRGRHSGADATPPRGLRNQAEAGFSPPAEQPPFLYRREDFSSNLLHSRAPLGLRSCANIKVRINTKSPWQKAVARDNLFHNLNDAETLLLNIDLEDKPLGQQLSALGGREKAHGENLAEQAQAFGLYLKQSIFQEAILLIDHLERKEDDHLLRFLLESGDIAGLTVILLEDSTAGECDLEFNEDPKNLMARRLPAAPNRAGPPGQDRDETGLLQRLARAIAGGRWAELEQELRELSHESPGPPPGPVIDLLCRLLPQLPPGCKALPFGIDVLIQADRLGSAARILAEAVGIAGPCLRLKKAHLAMRQKNYGELGEMLAGLLRVSPALRDEWLYLNFVYREKTGQCRKAAEFMKKIKSPYYRNLAVILWSDRGIYGRGFARARAQLDGAREYFSAQRRVREEIETLSQMAKLLREMGDFREAEALYKTIYIRSETDGLALNSAFAAVDLGNLYFEDDDDFQAECWYRKAAKLFARENNRDGIMLVNSNLLNILYSKGCWLEADQLLRAILAWDAEKRLMNACAIDHLNWANLEALRLHYDRALELVEKAAEIFQGTANSKGLSECAYVRGRISFFSDPTRGPAPPECPGLQDDQRIVCQLFAASDRGRATPDAPSLLRMLDGIRSNKIKFEALRLLLTKYRKSEWLDRFQEIARKLSPREKNYYYYEFWYMAFELGAEDLLAERRQEFLAMHDFFTVNQRSMSPKLDHLRRLCDEKAKDRALFDDARLVGNYRQWRLPEDFFNTLAHELAKTAPIDWLVMAIHEEQRPLFRFANSDLFKELGEELLRGTLEATKDQNHDLREIRRLCRSQERFFYPFANTKMVRWRISDRLLACLVIGFSNADSYFQDFSERHRETFKKFALLFLNFLQNEFRVHEKLDFIIGQSEKIKEMKRQIAQVSKVDFSLLITGESGSGKELVARAVHLLSPRAGHPFVSVNAAAIPEALLEAELFGCRKGAFSGAVDNRVGLLEAANRGTLFLDEIADLPLPLQAKLLRALQEKEIRRLGENKTIKIDVRLVSASNKDLNELIRNNLFRADLFYRLQDLVIHIPPLRERREDIPSLVAHFLEKFGFPAQPPATLRAISDMFRNEVFPGNVRELESKIKKMITFDPELEFSARVEKNVFSLKSAREDFERNLVLNTLSEQNWRRNRTAEKLGISRMALFNLIKKYKISRWQRGC